MSQHETHRTQRGFNRRHFIVAALSAVGLGGIYSWNRYRASRAAWVEQTVRRNLPGVTLDESSLAQFVRSVLESDLLEPQTHRVAVFAERMVPWLTDRIPKARDGLEKLERRVLTEYLLGSNFFRVADPKQETIVYSGPIGVCANPFARLG